jgi:endonuclease/exonuclease/phosphatase (EEP) superfamily protein YafD
MVPRALLSTTGWIFGCAVFAGLTLRWSVGDQIFLTRYVGYVSPWLLVALVPGVAWSWWADERALATLLGCSAAIIVAIHAPLFWPRGPDPARSAMTVTVVSYNTWSRNADEERIAKVLLERRPDVAMLQEIPPDVFERLMNRLGSLFGGAQVHYTYAPRMLQAIISRYPLESSTSLADKGQAQKAVLRSPAGPLVVFNVHPLRFPGWSDRYRRITALLRDEILPESGPVILAGDFNVTDQTQLYRAITEHLKNAHREAGYGFGFTFPSPAIRVLGVLPLPSMMRIDHIFFSGHFSARQAGTIEDSGGSDHRPVFAELELTRS